MAEPDLTCRDLVRDLPHAILGLGPKGEVKQMNPAAGGLLGVEPAQAKGQPYSQVFADHLKKGDELFQTIAKALDKGANLKRLVIPLEDASGATKYISLSTTPQDDGGLVATLDDVSQQEQARRAQQEQEARAHSLALRAEQAAKRLEQSLKGHKRLRLLSALLVILLFAGVGFYVWNRTHVVHYVEDELGDNSPSPGQGQIYTVRPQPLSSSISLSGSIEPFETINLLSPFAGRILERHFEYGQKVKQGALLLKLDTSDLVVKLRDARVAAIKAKENYQKLQNWKTSDTVLQARRQLNKAENDLEVTQQKLQESQMLFKQGIIPLDEYRSLKEQVTNQKISLSTLRDQLKAAIKKGSRKNLLVARLQLENAETKLARLEKQIKESNITAPVVGVVVRPTSGQGASGKDAKVIEVGYEVNKGQVLLALGNLERMAVSTQVGEINVAKLEKGQQVTITSYAFPGLSLGGRIDTVSSQASQSSNGGPPTFTVRVTTEKLSPQAQAKLRLGMSADLEVKVFSAPKALVVPIGAVHTSAKAGRAVTLALPGGARKEVPVKTGVTTPDLVEITSGLKSGDKVVLPGPASGAPSQS